MDVTVLGIQDNKLFSIRGNFDCIGLDPKLASIKHCLYVISTFIFHHRTARKTCPVFSIKIETLTKSKS